MLGLWWTYAGGVPVNRAVKIPDGPPYEYRGLIHCHTTDSDGGKSVPEVAAIADRLGLDFLVITDHNSLRGREHEGLHGGCRVLVGSEVSTNQGHLLAIGIPETAYRLGGPARDVTREVRLLDGLSVAAHPIHPSNGWGLSNKERPDGIEVFNSDSAWRHAPLWKKLLGIPGYLLNPERTFLQFIDDAKAERSLWDRYLADGPVTGLIGGDCHARIPVGPFAIGLPEYERCLDAFQTHILSETPLDGDFETDRELIIGALRQGLTYMSLGPIGPADGFRFQAVSGRMPSPVLMGGTISGSGPITFIAELPAEKPALLVLLRDGETVAEQIGERLLHTDDRPGVYRVEVYADRRNTVGGRIPWVLSNPIRIESEPRTLPAPTPRACPAGETLAGFERDDDGYTLWGDSTTLSGSSEIERSSPGAAGTDTALKFRFHLAPDDEGATWLMRDQRPHSYPGAQGISLYVRADQRLRLRLYVRDEDPVGPEDKEWFTTTFMVDEEWQCIPVAFDDLRCLSEGGNCRVDPDRISGIFLAGDTEVLTPGLRSVVWLDEVKLFYEDELAEGRISP